MSFKDVYLKLRSKLKTAEDLKVARYSKKAAVTIILYSSKTGFEALYVKRACNPLDPWSGQVAFPGGRYRENDKSIVKTAIREAYEETGIKLSKLDVVGLMESFHPLNEPSLEVIPVIALVNTKPNVKLSSELQEYFWAPLNKLYIDKVEVKRSNGKLLHVEAYIHGKFIIWGLTARITKNLIEILQTLREEFPCC